MGVDYTIYIGPYIQIHNPPRPYDNSYPCCVNEDCEKWTLQSTAKFCSQCGKPIGERKVKCKRPICVDLYEMSHDRLCQAFSEYRPEGYEEYLFIIPNIKTDFSISFNPVGKQSIIDLRSIDAIQGVCSFSQVFSKELEAISKIFGPDAVAIKHGILNWAW